MKFIEFYNILTCDNDCYPTVRDFKTIYYHFHDNPDDIIIYFNRMTKYLRPDILDKQMTGYAQHLVSKCNLSQLGLYDFEDNGEVVNLSDIFDYVIPVQQLIQNLYASYYEDWYEISSEKVIKNFLKKKV